MKPLGSNEALFVLLPHDSPYNMARSQIPCAPQAQDSPGYFY